MSIDNVANCFIVEDTHRDVKVAGETRIPAGTYKVGWCETLTPKTQKYRDDVRYKDFFKWHIEIKDVPNYTFIFCHPGQTEKDSEGCLLTNSTVDLIAGLASDSVRAFKNYYTKVGSALNAGEQVSIEIIDGDRT
jgi:hypothetical protein